MCEIFNTVKPILRLNSLRLYTSSIRRKTKPLHNLHRLRVCVCTIQMSQHRFYKLGPRFRSPQLRPRPSQMKRDTILYSFQSSQYDIFSSLVRFFSLYSFLNLIQLVPSFYAMIYRRLRKAQRDNLPVNMNGKPRLLQSR